MLAALDMAITQRRPDGVIHHSDQDGQYTSVVFGQRCRDAGVVLSMGSVGDCFDGDRHNVRHGRGQAAHLRRADLGWAGTSRRASNQSNRSSGFWRKKRSAAVVPSVRRA